MRLDKRFPFSTVYGSDQVKYEQGGLNFDAFGDLVTLKKVPKDPIIEHEKYTSAMEFLCRILEKGPLAKSVVYKMAEENCQVWQEVKKASDDPRFLKFKFGLSEAWKLKDEL